MKWLFALFALPATAFAECPPNPEQGDATAEQLTRLIEAPNAEVANEAANALWQLWFTAPDARAQDLLDRAVERRDSYDYEAAENLLDELVNYCPEYPEAYNQRAFIRFLRDKYDAALSDLDRVIAARPYHFGAHSGRAMTLMRQGRMTLAQQSLRRAVRIHPFLRERSMLLPEAGTPADGDL
ncbi:hypothetical protein GO499_11625 [Algicella marina]|uniref:Uncharacterized protein n=2 Tax=Algicella marina TaxID=2683284 RepID=A0A6P1T7B8_9RHOB|nr:hypothetical protein GO499_11625 [Algicella marina]